MNKATSSEEIQKRLAQGDRDLQGEPLPGVNLRGADLRGVNLRGANLRGANLNGADLREAKLIRTDLGMTDLGRADFSKADLNGADFRGANLKGANFAGAILDSANLRGSDLQGADLRGAILVRADLSRAELARADLREAELRGADLRGADLAGANLTDASLQSATLHGADLRGANLSRANLRSANLTDTRTDDTIMDQAMVGSTVFADLDLRQARGLGTLRHAAPSTVGSDTLTRSQGGIPEAFLRGCGLMPWEILAAGLYDPALTPDQVKDLQARVVQARAGARFPRRRILISYSAPDGPFVDALRACLLRRGVFTWIAPHEPKGAFRERQSKLPIQHDLTFLLVLSETSVQSNWAEHEVRLVYKLERMYGPGILCPISLDDVWKSSPWRSRILEASVAEKVLTFSGWNDSGVLEGQCARLLDGLSLFHPAAASPSG